MKTNVEKVLERDQKLSELDDRADALQQGASQFEQQAGKLKRKFWLQNLKVSLKRCRRMKSIDGLFLIFQMMIIMGVIGLIIVAYIGCKNLLIIYSWSLVQIFKISFEDLKNKIFHKNIEETASNPNFSLRMITIRLSFF